MPDRILALLEEGRRREKEQTLFYRRLAAQAGMEGDENLEERFNALQADEQHHLSRLTARIFELDGVPSQIAGLDVPAPTLDAWEPVARAREEAEVAWYEGALEASVDPGTRGVLEEIRASEVHHASELDGKCMSAWGLDLRRQAGSRQTA